MEGSMLIRSDDGDPLVRESLLVAFFAKRPFAGMVEGAAACFDQYLKMIPQEALKWSLIGSTASTQMAATTKDIARCRALLTVSTAKQKDVHFDLLGPEKWCPGYQVIVAGRKQPIKRGFSDQTNGFELLFPVEFLALYGEDAFVAVVAKMAELLQCDSGHAGIALVPGAPADFSKAASHMAPRLFRSHGLDIGQTRFVVSSLGNRSRGARWLTMLSNALVDELGGLATLQGKLADGVELVARRHGVLLRAGHGPEIGNVNRQQTTPLVASVARAIEGVTRFNERGMLQFFGNDPEKLHLWERRFW